MLNFEKNKIIASVIVAILILSVARNLGDAFYDIKHKMFQRGYQIFTSNNNQSTPTQAEMPKIDIPSLMAKANLELGKNLVKKCMMCHNVGKGEPPKIGPNLWNVFNRGKGGDEGYFYSEALKNKGGVWDEESLFAFLAAPKVYIPGNKMSFAGFDKVEDIANIVAFLKANKDA